MYFIHVFMYSNNNNTFVLCKKNCPPDIRPIAVGGDNKEADWEVHVCLGEGQGY